MVTLRCMCERKHKIRGELWWGGGEHEGVLRSGTERPD